MDHVRRCAAQIFSGWGTLAQSKIQQAPQGSLKRPSDPDTTSFWQDRTDGVFHRRNCLIQYYFGLSPALQISCHICGKDGHPRVGIGGQLAPRLGEYGSTDSKGLLEQLTQRDSTKEQLH